MKEECRVCNPQKAFKFVGRQGQLTLKATAKPKEKISGGQKRKVIVPAGDEQLPLLSWLDSERVADSRY